MATTNQKYRNINLGVRSKYLIILLSCTLFSTVVISYIMWSTLKETIEQNSYEHLVSIRNDRGKSINQFFHKNESYLKVLSKTDNVVNAMEKFIDGVNLIKIYNQKITIEQKQEVKSFYHKTFFPMLKKNSLETAIPNINKLIPFDESLNYLQYQYIVNNKHPIGEKYLMNDAKDESYYNKVHSEFHEVFSFIVKEFGFYDIFLIDKDSGDIVYSVFKEVDFGTNLLNGPYSESGLGYVVKNIINQPKKDVVIFQDFKPYKPSYNQPATFMAIPIYKENIYIGIIAIQLPIDQIDEIMTNGKKWKENGLGQSGEVYIIGSDWKMRSNPRSLIENKEKYIKVLESTYKDQNVVKKIDMLNTSVLNESISNIVIDLALNDQSGYKIIKDRFNEKVLSAYAPLKIQNLRWAIIAEKSIKEINQSVNNLELITMITIITLMGMISFISLLYSSKFLSPIYSMLDAIKNNLNDKKLHEDININHQDELNLLNIYINKIIDNAETDKYKISQEKIKYKTLLENFIPHNIAKDFNSLGGNISKNHDNIAILSIKISGINHLIQGRKNINKFSELFDLFKQLEVNHEIDKLTLVGNNYILSCGIHKPRIDYARRCVVFSIELFKLVKIFNQEENLSIGLQIGIHSGSIVSGIIGSENFIYSLWGDPINIANDIHCKTEINTLIITQSIYNQLVKKDSFKKYRVIDYPSVGNIITWKYTDTFK